VTGAEIQPILVAERNGRLWGYKVKAIRDVSNADSEIDTSVRDRPGILGNHLFGGRIVAILDLRSLMPSWVEIQAQAS
jgi:hypothetical protein